MALVLALAAPGTANAATDGATQADNSGVKCTGTSNSKVCIDVYGSGLYGDHIQASEAYYGTGSLCAYVILTWSDNSRANYTGPTRCGNYLNEYINVGANHANNSRVCIRWSDHNSNYACASITN